MSSLALCSMATDHSDRSTRDTSHALNTPPPHVTQHWRLSKPSAKGRRGMVVSQAKGAAEAGVALLDAGGNAIDAAVATALALATHQPWNSGLGGIGFALVHRVGQSRAEVVDFGPRAPGYRWRPAPGVRSRPPRHATGRRDAPGRSRYRPGRSSMAHASRVRAPLPLPHRSRCRRRRARRRRPRPRPWPGTRPCRGGPSPMAC